MEYHIEHFKKLQELIETNLEALSQAHYNQEEVRKQIAVIIVSRFKKYLKLTKQIGRRTPPTYIRISLVLSNLKLSELKDK